MARISGVDLPREKRVEIGLTYIYGIGLTSSKRILTEDPGLKNHPEILSNVTKLFEAYSLD